MKLPDTFLKTLIILAVGLLAGFLIARAFEKPKKSPTAPKYTSQVLDAKSESYSPTPNTIAGQTAKVVRVIDGDTVQIEGGQKIRYIGIDTPEIVDPRSTVQCFGREASFKNRELVEGKSVILEKDISQTDKFGRLLRYVFLEDPSTSSGLSVFVNDYLVREGFARASSYPPDIKYQEQLRQAEQEARQNQRGLWGQCPKDDQKQPITSNQTVPDSDCQIKGNISSSGEKIYHLPEQKYYDKTVIDESRGERWFCTEGEAISAGWRKSKI